MGEVFEFRGGKPELYAKNRHFIITVLQEPLYLSKGSTFCCLRTKWAFWSYWYMKKEIKHVTFPGCTSLMDISGEKPPVPLNTPCAEGPAVSLDKMRISWTHRDRQLPELGKNRANYLMAEIIIKMATHVKSNKKERFLIQSNYLFT